MKSRAPLWLWALVGFAGGVGAAFINPYTRMFLEGGDGATKRGVLEVAQDGLLLAVIFVVVGLLIRLVVRGMSL